MTRYTTPDTVEIGDESRSCNKLRYDAAYRTPDLST